MKTYAKITAVVGPVALCLAAAACGGGSGAGGNESASDYPSRPVTFIIPYSAGGGSDQQFRLSSRIWRSSWAPDSTPPT